MVFHTMIQRQKLCPKKASLRKILKIVPDYIKITGQQLQGSGIEAKADVGIEGY